MFADSRSGKCFVLSLVFVLALSALAWSQDAKPAPTATVTGGQVRGIVYIATPLPAAGLPTNVILQLAGAILLAILLAALACPRIDPRVGWIRLFVGNSRRGFGKPGALLRWRRRRPPLHSVLPCGRT